MQTKNTLKWINGISRKQQWKIVLLILANAFFSVLSVAFAFAIRAIINGATNPNKELGKTIFLYGIIAIGIIVVLQFVFRILMNGLSEHVKGKLEISFKSHLFKSVLAKKYDNISTYHSGELLNRLTSDVKVVSEGITQILPTVVSAVTRLVCAVVALVIIDWVFAVAFVVAGLLVFLVMGFMRKKLKSYHKKTQQTDGKVRSFMQESIENLLAVKVFSAEERIEQKSSDLQQENFNVKMKRKNYSVVGHAIYNFIFSAGYVFALIFGSMRLFSGTMGFSYGDLSAVLQLVNNVQVPFASLSTVFPVYYSVIASAERLIEVESLEEENISKSNAKNYSNQKNQYNQSLVIDNVSFSYGEQKVLKNLSLTIEKGEFVTLLGRSGIGKSTIVKLLLGIYDLDEGEIYFANETEKIKIDENTRSYFAYVPQGNMIFSGSLKENITFANAFATDEQIKKALSISCADEFVDSLDEGLETFVGENGAGLSEGQVQRIAIARAILSDAPVLILDESTSALDEETERKLLENLRNMQDKTVIFISHRKAVLAVSDRSITIKGGKAV